MILNKKITILFLIIIYFIIIYIQYYLINSNLKINKNYLSKKEIEFNIKNQDNINNKFKNLLLERLKLLKSKNNREGRLNYEEWLEYNKKNLFFKFGENSYYIFIYENINKTDRFLSRVHFKKSYLNLTFDDIVKDTKANLVFTKYTTDKKLIDNMFNDSNSKLESKIGYYWIDPMTNLLSKKISLYSKYEDEYNNCGIIGIGYNIENLLELHKFIYFEKTNKYLILSMSLLSIIMTIIIILINKETFFSLIKALFILIVLNYYFYYFLNTLELSGSVENEKYKILNINEGILSMSFLYAVNIFILNSLNKSFKANLLFIESSIFFTISLVVVLSSVFKVTNYNTIDNLLNIRVSKQFLFNSAIVINVFIIINYLVFMNIK